MELGFTPTKLSSSSSSMHHHHQQQQVLGAKRSVTAEQNDLNKPTTYPSPLKTSAVASTATTTTPTRPSTSKMSRSELEHENKLLRSALVRMKQLVDYCQEGNRTSNALLEGAYNYCKQKKASATRSTPQKRQFHAFPLAVRVSHHVRVGDHYEYEIEVKFGDSGAGHRLTKRFSEFRALRHATIALATAKQQGAATTPPTQDADAIVLHTLQSAPFPPRTWFKCEDERTLLLRCDLLGKFLLKAVEAGRRAGRNSPVRQEISCWLGITQQDEDLVWCDERIRPLLEHDSRTKATRNSDAFHTMLLEEQQTPVRGVTFILDSGEDGDDDDEVENHHV